MRSSKVWFAAIFAVCAAAANAASIDMNDPRRALGREDNVRVDAQLVQDTIASGSPIAITYQIQNLSPAPVAVADKVTDVTYDADSATITVAIGSEVPDSGALRRLVLIGPGEKKIFTTAATAYVNTPSNRTPWTVVPRYVQVKVNILRDLAPFRALIDSRRANVTLSDEQFDQWLESNDTILLNSIPVRWAPRQRTGAEVDHAGLRGTF